MAATGILATPHSAALTSLLSRLALAVLRQPRRQVSCCLRKSAPSRTAAHAVWSSGEDRSQAGGWDHSPAEENRSAEPSGDRSRELGTTAAVFWDLDNKPPENVRAALAVERLRSFALRFAREVDILAYANRHAFTHVPEWVREERREQRRRAAAEERAAARGGGKGGAGGGTNDEAGLHVCGLCGRTCRSSLALAKHFKQLHERERQKRMSRLNSLKGAKKRSKFKASVADREGRYLEAARKVLTPKYGYNLMPDLQQAGVFVRQVSDAPQAADDALNYDLERAVRSRQVDTVLLISDDGGFAKMLAWARASGLQVVAVGNGRSLKKSADLWFDWGRVLSGDMGDPLVDASSHPLIGGHAPLGSPPHPLEGGPPGPQLGGGAAGPYWSARGPAAEGISAFGDEEVLDAEEGADEDEDDRWRAGGAEEWATDDDPDEVEEVEDGVETTIYERRVNI